MNEPTSLLRATSNKTRRNKRHLYDAEQARQQARTWYAANRDKVLEYQRRYRAEHTDYVVAKREEHRRKKKQGIDTSPKCPRMYYHGGLVEARNIEREQSYYQKNKERILARVKEWQSNNPEKVKEYKRRFDLKKTRLSEAGSATSHSDDGTVENKEAVSH